jgi:hypothetical protein
MKNIIKDSIAYDDMMVLNKKNQPITGLTDGNFSKKLFDPDGIERTSSTAPITVTVNELGSGAYRVNFTPDKNGNWFLIIYNTSYFAYGKGENYYASDETIATIADEIKRILGLVQENYRVFDTEYDNRRNLVSGKIKIYPTATDVDSDTNEIAEYEISATYNKLNHMTGYKVKKI